MAIGYHSRAMHGHKDPTSSPTRKRGKAHMETVAASDNNKPEQMGKGTRMSRLRARAKSTLGEGE